MKFLWEFSANDANGSTGSPSLEGWPIRSRFWAVCPGRVTSGDIWRCMKPIWNPFFGWEKTHTPSQRPFKESCFFFFPRIFKYTFVSQAAKLYEAWGKLIFLVCWCKVSVPPSNRRLSSRKKALKLRSHRSWEVTISFSFSVVLFDYGYFGLLEFRLHCFFFLALL